MSIYNAGAVIKEARQKAGLSRERLSEGICSEHSLKRIENGIAGISPSTFQRLMERAGVNGNVFPIFTNRDEYQVFRDILEIRYYLDCWQLDIADGIIARVDEKNYADNKLYYQQCQLYKGILLLKSYTCDYCEVKKIFKEALDITCSYFELDVIRDKLFSITELELLIGLAECMVYLDRTEDTLMLTEQIAEYLDNTQISYREKLSLKAKNTVVSTKALLKQKDYEKAFEIIEDMRKLCVSYNEYPVLLELTFLAGVCQYYKGNIKESYHLCEKCYYTAYSSHNPYATVIWKWVENNGQMRWNEKMLKYVQIPLKKYHYDITAEIPEGDGIYDIERDRLLAYQLGDIIRDTRKEKGISQEVLATGLCNRSALSKIENNVMYPDKFLAEALLQRLGIYSEAFMMFGDTKDFQISELKKQITAKIVRYQHEEAKVLLLQLEELLNEKDIINRQFHCFVKAFLVTENEEPEMLKKAIECTVQLSEEDSINERCLSYNELTILNNLVRIKIKTDEHKGIELLIKLKEYYDCKNYDILERNRTYPITIYSLIKSLYNVGKHQELVKLFSEILTITNSYSYLVSGRIYFFYCQSLMELGMTDTACFWAKCACCNLELTGKDSISSRLKDGFFSEYGLIIE